MVSSACSDLCGGAARVVRRRAVPTAIAVLRGEKAPDDALARELGAMGLL